MKKILQELIELEILESELKERKEKLSKYINDYFDETFKILIDYFKERKENKK